MIGMKFVIFYDYNPEDMEKITEKWNEILKMRERIAESP
jgi:hypothetical protein